MRCETDEAHIRAVVLAEVPRLNTLCCAAAADEPSKGAGGFASQRLQSVKSLFTPFSDPAVNARLVALCVASALCSVATLIHDTYLPVYLQDQLGLSNTKVNLLVKSRKAESRCKLFAIHWLSPLPQRSESESVCL